ncbi:MAG TPA: Rossmann-like and DUF2520 domain-containing protein [Bryobacteraceae bacterium]|nr:Rossmann-like and DUF2520 domain-containing protein [Bryobacteraceae bacterium]
MHVHLGAGAPDHLSETVKHGPIGIAGGGRVAQAIGRILRDKGEPVVSVASRSHERASAAAEFIGAGVQPVTYEELPRYAARILIAVSDDAVESVAARLAADSGIALHTCGAKGPEALRSLQVRGVHCGTLHPLQTFPDAATGVAGLHNIAFAVSGDSAAVEWADQIVALTGSRSLHIKPELRPLYHAAAAMASNYIVALLAASETVMTMAGVETSEALPALSPLIRASIDHVLRFGPVAALTGPIQRGDVATINSHVNALASAPEPVRLLYRAAGLEALEIAKKRDLNADTASSIEKILRNDTSNEPGAHPGPDETKGSRSKDRDADRL